MPRNIFSSRKISVYFSLLIVALVFLTLGSLPFLNSYRTKAATNGPALSLNAGSGRHAISPDIYGLNFADASLASELRLPVDRWGGNSTTRYNWQNDTSNKASDWFFENIANNNANVAALPNGSASDLFVEQDRRTGTKSIMTMPLIGYTPKARDGSCGFSVAKYGPQQNTDQWRPDCGNGVKASGGNITGNDPLDTSLAITPAFDQAWINHLISRYGNAQAGGVKFYQYDNEPDLWNSTHRDVHPQGISYDELRDRTFLYGAAIKAADPTAQTLGPADWGWVAYQYSGLDSAPGGQWWLNPQDYKAHNSVWLAEWYLQQMAVYEKQHGTRILDYFDEHFYPQETGVSLSSAGDATTQALRLESTRALWDPTYNDPTWINTPVMLIPRFHSWVNKDYPGTKISLSEYNWGGLESMNGALTQADILGIFGRENLDLATMWGPPTPNQPGAYAFRMYRNYDGKGSAFGEQSILSTSADQGKLAIYGATRSSDNALTVMVVNKTGGDLTSNVALSQFNPAANAQSYLYSKANLQAIVPQANIPVSAGGFTTTFPANSIMLVVIPASGTAITPSITKTLIPTGNITKTPTKTRTPIASRTPTKTPTRTKTPVITTTPTKTNTPRATSTSTPTPTLPVQQGVSLKAQYQVGDPNAPDDNFILPQFQLINTGNTTVDLSKVTVRYWYTLDGGSPDQSYNCDWGQIGCSNVQGSFGVISPARTGADHYLQVSYKSSAGTLNPGDNTGQLKLRVNKTDWSNYHEADDYSYNQAFLNYTDWGKVTVYYNGALVWGVEP